MLPQFHSKCHLDRLEAIQNHAACFIVSNYSRENSIRAI